MVDGKMKERFAFVNSTLVSKVGMGEQQRKISQQRNPIILVIVKHFVIFQILIMYIMLCQPFCFMSFSFFLLVSFHQVSLHLTSYHWWSSFPARYYSNLSSMFI